MTTAKTPAPNPEPLQSTSSLPNAASVVVIGGGAMGSSTLYHLAKLGVEQPLLLERDRLTSGTSWHSAAQVRALRSTENLTRLIQYSARLYQSLEAETGQNTGWLETGSLSIAATPDRLAHIKRQVTLARAFGLEADLVSAREAGDLWPMMETSDLIGAAFSPSDGRVNPSDLCAALIRGARANGAQVVEHAPVVGFRLRNGSVAAVETPLGVVECDKVIICAGLWSRQVGALAGADAPLYACEHFYLLTEPMPGVTGHLPTLGDHDAHLYLRDDVGGLLVGSFEPDAKPISLNNLPRNFSFDLLDEDWEHFEPMMHNAIRRIPELETAGIRMLLNGPESFTPDGGFLLGESPDVGGLYFGCGMNSMGLASSGGAGWALAEWAVKGTTPFDLSPVDARRYAPIHNNLRFLAARAPETLTLHYALSFDGREHESGRGLRTSPVHHRLVEHGARFGERGGWERPAWFQHEQPIDETLTYDTPGWDRYVGEEHRAAREQVALFDQSSFAKLLVQGPDAEALLQRLCANDVAVRPGRCVYTGMLNARGGYESDLTLMRLADDAYALITGTAQLKRDWHWIRKNIGPDERVTATDVTSGWSVLGLYGPQSRGLLGTLTGTALDNQAFPYFSWQLIEVGMGLARAARVSYAGELGWELHIPSEMALGVYESIITSGRDFGLRHGGTMALTSLRIEKGYRAWGHELTPDDTPYEAGLDFAVKLSKPQDFIGKAALASKREQPLRRRLVSLRMPDHSARALGGEPLVCNDHYVGQVTSAAFGYTVGEAVGMGYIRCEDGDVDAYISQRKFEIEIAMERYPVIVSTDALYDPSGERLRM